MFDYLQHNGLQQARLPCHVTSSQSLLKLMSIESVMPSNHLILCRPLPLLPPISPSIKVFSSESDLRMRWPKYWSFSFSISPFHKYSGLMSFRIDWFDLLAVQGTLKSLLQHHSSKASTLWHSALRPKFQSLATWWEELIHCKRPWCWERLKAGGEGADRGWDGWMASPT